MPKFTIITGLTKKFNNRNKSMGSRNFFFSETKLKWIKYFEFF